MFDVYFNLNAEDTYLVQNISQHLRNRGMTTFDRSVDRLPNDEAENLSEADALDASKIMVYVLTENSVDDPSDQDMLARADAADKRIIVMHFDDVDIPERLVGKTLIEANRANLGPALKVLDREVA